jgi:phosphoglycolate phosphatase-like HAD superfamily hydrolase
MPCVGVLYGKTADWEELEAAGAAAIVESVDGLRDVLLG